jgi:DNA-binding GntR family transcriptional regulator
MGMERIEVQTLSDRAYVKLERAIIAGELAPGVALSEAELAEQLGISRGPLREAINRLEGRRLVQRVPHVGVRVVSLSDADTLEIFQMRAVLEGLACRLASQQMDQSALDRLEACAGFRPSQLPHGPLPIRTGKDFHVRVAIGSGNSRLIEYLCTDMYPLLRLYRARSSVTPARADAPAEHLEIVAAMRRRDSDAAEQLMRAHIERAQQSLSLDSESSSAAVPTESATGHRIVAAI